MRIDGQATGSAAEGAYRQRRPTIADIARQAGLTKTAVSFALNGQPGVSARTRRRVLDIARDIGWQPNSAARALSDGRADACGLVVDRPARTLGVEPWFMQFISGVQAELSGRRIALLFTVAEDQDAEIELYRDWFAQGRVDGVFVVNLRVNDRRIGVLEELGMPAVVIGDPAGAGSLPAVWHDDTAATRTVVEHLAALGHRRIARVSGIAGLWHTEIRTRSFLETAEELGVGAVCVDGDYTAERGAEATRELLDGPAPPTALVYDNDLMAIAGLLAAQRAGMRVPTDLSIVAWEDSPLCELVHPPVTALRRDVVGYGAHAARHLLAARDGMSATADIGNVMAAAHELVRRGSTGRPRAVRR